MSAPTKTWMFSDEANLRLQVVSLAVRAHESGLANDGASVLDTARQLAEFIQGDN